MTPGAGGLQQAVCVQRRVGKVDGCGGRQLTVQMIASQLDLKKDSV